MFGQLPVELMDQQMDYHRLRNPFLYRLSVGKNVVSFN